MARFTKYNNPNRKHYRKPVRKHEYFPTIQELRYCRDMGIEPAKYVDMKYQDIEEAKERRG